MRTGKWEIRRTIFYFLFLISYFSFISACSLPRIIVLEDPLSPEEHLNLGVAYERKGELDGAIRSAMGSTSLRVIDVRIPRDDMSPQLATMSAELARLRGAK